MKKLALCLLALSLAVFMAGSAFADAAVTSADITVAALSADFSTGVLSVDLTNGKSVDVKVASLDSWLQDARFSVLSVDTAFSKDVEIDDYSLGKNVLYIKKSALSEDTLLSVASMFVSSDVKLATSDVYFLLEGSTYKSLSTDSGDWKTYVNSADQKLSFISGDYKASSYDFTALTTVYGTSCDLEGAVAPVSTDFFKAYVQVVDKLPSEVAEDNFKDAITNVSNDITFASDTGVVMLTSEDLGKYLESSDVIMDHAKKSELEAVFGASMDKKSNDFNIKVKDDSTSKTFKGEDKDFTTFAVEFTASEDKTVALIVTGYTDSADADFNLMLTSADAAKLDANDSFKFSFTMSQYTEIYMGTTKVTTEYADGMQSFYATLTNSPDKGVKFSDLVDGKNDFTIKETTVPSGDSSSGCNAMGFVPAALLLVAPLFFLKK